MATWRFQSAQQVGRRFPTVTNTQHNHPSIITIGFSLCFHQVNKYRMEGAQRHCPSHPSQLWVSSAWLQTVCIFELKDVNLFTVTMLEWKLALLAFHSQLNIIDSSTEERPVLTHHYSAVTSVRLVKCCASQVLWGVPTSVPFPEPEIHKTVIYGAKTFLGIP